ncbi:MAG: ThuA domain-containing protein [Planctomycetaceae bacterium]|nr:ThuA domain-containing protein [Planctomycetaceae bacterium]
MSVYKIFPLFLLFFAAESFGAEPVRPVRILFIAGQGSHGYGVHEFYAGSVLLAEALEHFVSEKPLDSNGTLLPEIKTTIHRNAKPGDTFMFDDADVVVVFCDGGGRYPLRGQEDRLEKLRQAGKGFVFLHYALCGSQGNDAQKPSALPPDAQFILKATGGVYEIFHSVNPSYTAEFKSLPDHPVTRGVRPFSIDDEWYFHMRFLNDWSTEQILDRTVPNLHAILVTVPPDETKQRRDGAHSGNPTVRNRLGKPEIVAWAFQRDDGGRGFGLTGGDQHWNFANPDFRKLLLNAILWTAKAEVPPAGVSVPSPDFEELQKNLDEPNRLTPEMEKTIRQQIDRKKKESVL